MTKPWLKRVLIGSASLFFVLVAVLGMHIYIVTHQPPDPNMVAMARIDFKQEINQDDADKVTAFLSKEKGVSRVLVNPKTEIAVFTFFPMQTNANQVVADFKSKFDYKADRYVPTEAELKGGCPISSASFSYKAAKFIKQIF